MDSSDGSVGAETMLELISATRDGDLAAVRALIASITAGGGGAVAAKDDQALEGAGNQPAAATIAAHELPTALVTLLPPSSTVTSALTLAVCLGHNDIVAYFVKDLGCDCNADSPRVGTPLQSAATHGNGEVPRVVCACRVCMCACRVCSCVRMCAPVCECVLLCVRALCVELSLPSWVRTG